MKMLIKYDPDERVLARQALKETYFRDLRDAEKERLAGTASLGNTVDRNDRVARSQKDKMANSSTGSIGGGSDTPVANAQSRSNSPSEKERTGGLPTITQAVKARKPIAAYTGVSGLSAVASNREPEVSEVGGSEGEDPEDGTVLPPIGGIKGKRDSKAKEKVHTFKSAGQSTLQKTSMSSMHGGTHLGSSKGFTGSLGVTVGGTSSMSATGTLSSSHAQNWSGKDNEMRVSNRTTTEKMNSTWAPNQSNNRKFVSPFSTQLRDPKKR
jgi:hypothetical protein